MSARFSSMERASAHLAAAVADPLPEPLRVVSPPAIELRGISKSWRRGRPVLDGVDLELPGGTAIRLSGRNGVGKTTLLRIAAGLIGADSGTVEVAGLRPDAERREFQRRVALLTAGSSGLYARLTVRRHLELWGRLTLLDRPRRASAIERALEEFMLGDLAGSRVDRISMGQRQRVRLAMAFMHDPLVVLLDEPANSLDDVGTELLCGAVSSLCRREGVAIWCCPSGDRPPFSFDRAYVLADGALHAD